MKPIVALAALLTAAPAMPVGTYEHDEKAIVLVQCQRALGRVSGSAFKVGPNTYVTADHVVREGRCYVAGVQIEITHRDEKRDYATFTGPVSVSTLRTSCAGFQTGRAYLARGYPGGGSFNISAPWQAIPLVMDHFRVFVAGDAIPGMSGGPVMDDSGRAIGIVSKRYPARSMALKYTGFCKR